MKDDLEQLLKSLHLRKIAEIFDEEAKRAENADLSYQEFVARLLRAQWQANQEAALAWRIKRAGLPEEWTLESFPFKRQPGVNARQIRTFAELEFVPKAENIVFIGPTGVGKTGLASALLLKALQNGHRSVFMRAGGERYEYVPALNAAAAHARCLADLIGERCRGWTHRAGAAALPHGTAA